MKVESCDKSVRAELEDKKNKKNLDQFLNKLENFDKNLTKKIENDLNTKQYIKAQYYKLNKKVYCNKPTLEKMKIKYDKVNSHTHLSAAFCL